MQPSAWDIDCLKRRLRNFFECDEVILDLDTIPDNLIIHKKRIKDDGSIVYGQPTSFKLSNITFKPHISNLSNTPYTDWEVQKIDTFCHMCGIVEYPDVIFGDKKQTTYRRAFNGIPEEGVASLNETLDSMKSLLDEGYEIRIFNWCRSDAGGIQTEYVDFASTFFPELMEDISEYDREFIDVVGDWKKLKEWEERKGIVKPWKKENNGNED